MSLKLSEVISLFSECGVPDPKYDARRLFSEICKIPDYKLFTSDVECDSPELYEAVRRRQSREPLQYILGYADFYRERYKVTEATLIPRADTELLVETAIKRLPDGAFFIDLCTGSGAVAISTLKNTCGTTAIATDISEAALTVAEHNAALNGVSSRLSLLLQDVLSDPPPSTEQRPFAVLSNPPYVKDSVYSHLENEIYFEPRGAFVGGEDGADFYRSITAKYRDVISDGGFIAYEIGYDQSEIITRIAEDNRMTAEILTDLGGNPRVALLTKQA